MCLFYALFILNITLEPKLDVGIENESIKPIPSHSEQIKAKLNERKNEKSKVAITNTIEQFFYKSVDVTNDNQNSQVNILEENPVPSCSEKCVLLSQVDDEEHTINKVEQENIVDDESTTLIDNSNNKKFELLNSSVRNLNGKHTDSNKHSYLETFTEKLYDKEDCNNDSMTILNMSAVEKVDVKSTKIDNCLPEVNPNLSIEIDHSVAPKDRKCVVVEINLEQIKKRLEKLKFDKSEKCKGKTRFFAAIDPNANSQAESELSREISKDMFSCVSMSYFKY